MFDFPTFQPTVPQMTIPVQQHIAGLVAAKCASVVAAKCASVVAAKCASVGWDI